MPKFIVKHTAILHDGKRYEVGSEIELTAEQAENNALNLQAVVTETKTTAPAAVTEEDVAAAEANIANAEAEKVAEAEKATKAKPAKEKEK